IAHITGGGITENLPRVLPKTCQAKINPNAWTMPPVMQFIQKVGGISDTEMRRVFNCGIGLIMVVPKDHAADTCHRITTLGEAAWVIGEIDKRPDGEPGVCYV
ncbi:MAG: AIR synthase-related protein, partial [Sideroxyarcus sp.]|nr:AIR synthase-related protein [Sideroxyarcus sp.]